MLSFLEFILSEEYLEEEKEKEDPSVLGSAGNDTTGKLHETAVAKFLNGGKFANQYKNENHETPKEAHNHLASRIHPDDYRKIMKNASGAARDILQRLKKTHPGHKITSVKWTSKHGDTQKVTGVPATQKEDSSDIYVTTEHPETGEVLHHGISLKATGKSSKHITSANLGQESSGNNAARHLDTHRKKILKSHPELQNMNADSRKEWAKKNPEKHENIKSANRALLTRIAHDHAAELQTRLNTGDHKHVINHIRDVLGARITPAEKAGVGTFIKHTTYQTADGPQYYTSHPGKDYEHILKDHKNITVKASGGSVHFYHKGVKFASQAHKFSSQSDPLSSIASAGKAV
jgi:hypothetical protein